MRYLIVLSKENCLTKEKCKVKKNFSDVRFEKQANRFQRSQSLQCFLSDKGNIGSSSEIIPKNNHQNGDFTVKN